MKDYHNRNRARVSYISCEVGNCMTGELLYKVSTENVNIWKTVIKITRSASSQLLVENDIAEQSGGQNEPLRLQTFVRLIRTH